MTYEISLDDRGLVIEAIKTQHKKLGREIEKASSSDTISKKQHKRKTLGDIAVHQLGLDRIRVNNWE